MDEIEINGVAYPIGDEKSALLPFLRQHGLVSYTACNGNGRCGKCKVQYISPAPKASLSCLAILTKAERDAGIRLACMCSVSKAKITVVDHRAFAIENSFSMPVIDHERKLTFLPFAFESMGSDAGSLQQYIEKKYALQLPYRILKRVGEVLAMPKYVGNEETEAELVLLDNQVVAISYSHSSPVTLNLDIGTTTIALCAVEVISKKIIANEKCLNSQLSFGADVINRISHANLGHFTSLCRLVQKSCLDLIKQILKAVDAERVIELNIAANTTMLHFLLQLNPILIGRYPFIGIKHTRSSHSFEDIFCSRKLDCDVNILPSYSAYIGADIVAGLSYLAMQKSKSVSLLVDLGTNGELVLGNQNKMLCTSTACGPAFEGGHLECGMPSFAGAISRVRRGDRGQLQLDTIAGVAAKGLCGSAAIDLLALLIEDGEVDRTGLLNIDYQQRVELGNQVYFSQKDIRELQLAKSAVRTAIEILIYDYGCNYADIEQVYLSGGFGSNVSIASLVGIGLLPKQLSHKAVIKGNTSLAGVVKFSLSANRDKEIQDVLEILQLVSLENHIKFNELYADNMLFIEEL